MSADRHKDLSENRRGRFDYDISDSYEAGIELEGQEVKSVKAGRGNLSGSHVLIRNGEAWLMNASIPPYQPKNADENYDPSRTRRLLLKQAEIRALTGRVAEKGIALIPLRMYESHGLVKVELGLGRSRKAHDKRELLKKRDTDREMRRTVGR
jgi:SsrA-binding protein